jgi:hypothetical protein
MPATVRSLSFNEVSASLTSAPVLNTRQNFRWLTDFPSVLAQISEQGSKFDDWRRQADYFAPPQKRAGND